FGHSLRGMKGWFFLGWFYFQPVELIKLIFIIVLAKIWAEKVKEANELKRIILSFLFLLPLVILTFFQPDFGSSLIFIFIWFFITSLNIQKIKYIIFILIFFILISLFFWQFILKDYQKARIITFFSPQKDPFGQGYQISQAKIAVGAGGLFGRGIGKGSQGQMRFLPASRTDFIFATLAEELGFFGSVLLIGLFVLIFLKIIRISRLVYDNFSFFLILGIGFNLFLHVVINIGMNLGLLPIVGLPLPLLSYGGSHLITTLISLGIVESIVIHQKIPFT
ncbi:MAG: FtsW/RodA/SpoVE family cell cycle protein, partial [Patescibacteria group bacterium]